MKDLRYEEVAQGAELFLGLVRGRIRAPGVPTLAESIEAARRRTLPREALADAIVARLVELGAPAESLVAAERLRRDGVVAVVAGQQPVLFGGPLLVAVKALAAVATARRLESQGVPAVAVYWSASEDHDHAEAESVGLLSAGGSLERLTLRLPRDGRMLSATPLPAEAPDLARRLAALLPDGPGRDGIAALVVPRIGETAASWNARIVLGLVGRFGLVLVEPETLRPFATQVVRHEIERPGVLAAAVEEGERAIADVHGLVRPLRLPRSELWYVVRDGVRSRPASERDLADALRSPSMTSWNVAGRVLAQDAALPVAAQICGPAELAYCSALGPAHAVLGVPCPGFVARPGLTLVEPRIASLCGALGVTPEDVVRDPACLAPAPVAAPSPAIAEVRRLAESLPPGSGAAARRRRAALLRNLALYEAALAREAAERGATSDARRTRVLSALRPNGSLQEREVSILSFVARHGPAILDSALAALGRDGAEHVVLGVTEP